MLNKRIFTGIIRLIGLGVIAAASCASLAQAQTQTDIEVLHLQLTLKEGESATLVLFRASSAPTSPTTITLEIEESGKPFLEIDPAELTVSEAGDLAISATATDNPDFVGIEPFNIMLSVAGGAARLTPTQTIAVSIENDDIYDIGFEQDEITIAEGRSETVLLVIDPAPSGANTVAVGLSVSDDDQLTVEPQQVIFSASSASFDVVVDITEDAVPEFKDIFTVSLTPPEDIISTVSAMSVTVPADSDAPIVSVFVERAIIPEGMSASVFVDAELNRDLTIDLAVSGSMGSQAGVSLSSDSLALSVDKPSTSFSISVADNEESQGGDRTFNVALTATLTPQPDLSSLTFTIPPNDLTAFAAASTEFKIEEPERTLTISTTPELRGNKSFLVFSEDPRLIVKTGVVTPAQSPFSVELALSEDAVLGREELLSLSISHLDSWQPTFQAIAQAQLGVGGSHSCAIKADGTMVCWGATGNNRSNPVSASGVDANTRFLAVSANHSHTCAIKADNTVACWGDNGSNRANPASAAGVDANTRFFAVSAGFSVNHSCGIKADSIVACWGSNGSGKSNPASAAGVDANTRFLAVSVASDHSCGIKADNTMACWGSSGSNRTNPASAAGVDANTRFFAVSSAESYSCGVKADGRIACWGANVDNRVNPTRAAGIDANTRFFAVSLNNRHGCGIREDNTVACWGNNGSNRANPTSAAGIDANTRFLAVSAGDSHNCAIKEDGTAACWGNNGGNRATPPSGNFAQTPDVFRLTERSTVLATEDGEEPVQFNEVTDVGIIPELRLKEGETATLTLFRVLSGMASPLTITLAIEESATQFLTIDPAELTIIEAGGTAAVTIAAPDNDEFADIDPVNIMLSITGDNARLTPTQTIKVNIENDDIYTIGFAEEEITLAEGMSETVQLSITPTPSGASTVAVALSVSDDDQLTVEPQQVVFSATTASFGVAVDVTEDTVPELADTFTVSLTPPEDIVTMTTAMSVIVPADSDTPIVRVFAERDVIPEGAIAFVFIDAVLNQELLIDMAVSGLMSTQTNVILSSASLTLSVDKPSTLFSISVADNGEPQAANRVFNVDLDTEFAPEPDLPSLAFTIPPNDLTAHAAMRAEFKVEEPEQTLTINTRPELQDNKSFIVSSDDPRLIVKTGLITSDQPSFSIELALSEDAILGREELLNLSITHLNSWQPFTQASAQYKIASGNSHTCAIRENGTMACWGSNNQDRASLTRSPQGVTADTRFLAVSAAAYSCSIRADSTAACWGSASGSRAINPASAAGVDANTKFLSVTSGFTHSCGIKADSTVVCWGSNGSNQSNPASAAGVDADTRFLAVTNGNNHSCGIKEDNTMACWGSNQNSRANPASSLQGGVNANTRFSAVNASSAHNCGIKTDGTLACWGVNFNNRANPTSAAGIDANTRFFAVSVGDAHGCGIKIDNTVACWGNPAENRANPASSPHGVNANTRFLAVSLGTGHGCGIKEDGTVACWGRNSSGQRNRPSGNFSRTPDLFRLDEQSTTLATQNGEEPVQFNEVTDVEAPQLTLKEGETTTLTLFRVLSGPASPVTVTLQISESDQDFLSIEPEEFVLTATERERSATVTSLPNDDYAHIDPISVMLSITGDNVRLTPTQTIIVNIENDDIYAIGFAEEEITLAEGSSETVQLSIEPAAPLGTNTVTVALAVSDNEQLTVSPEELVFSASTASHDVVVTVIEDSVPETTGNFTVNLALAEDIPAVTTDLSVIAPIDRDTPTVNVVVERTVIPEGTTAFVAIDAILNKELIINMPVSGLTGAQRNAILSPPSLRLSPDNTSATFGISVADNEQPQAANRVFNVDLSTEFDPSPELPSLTFAIPPNDLTAFATTRVEFKIEEPEQTLTINIEPPLQNSKSFLVSSEDPRFIVETGLITPAQPPFPVELALREGTILGEEERLSLNISHLDSWRHRSAQTQLSANNAHNCGIKADGTLSCWGSNDSNRANPASAAGVDANTRFLAVSAGHLYSCGIKADGTMACWGSSASNRTNPASAAGVNANTRFLAVNAGDSHTCAIKADSRVACWGHNANNRANPASAAGVNANTRFLAVNAGDSHTCAIKADNTLACWGNNANNRANPASAAGVDANTRFLAVSAGGSHSCGIKADSAPACWGNNADNRATPASAAGVDANTRFLAVSAGGSHTCAIKADGRMACWGNNTDNRANPTNAAGVDASTRFLAVGAGAAHTCAIKSDGTAACWGSDSFNRATPPSDNFNRMTLDIFTLAEQSTALATPDGEEPVQFNEVTEVEPLHSQLTIREGETTALTLFRVSSGPANPITITLAIEESDERFLGFSSTQLVISEAGGEVTASIEAIDNDDYASIDPVSIMLSITGDNVRLVPAGPIAVTIENDDFYAIGFAEEEITVAEGTSRTVQLSISPPPSAGADTVAVALSVSDNDQIAVEPEEVVFTATSASFDVVITAIEDSIPEIADTFTVSLTPAADIPSIISTELSVIVPIDNDTPIVTVAVERAVIPEGTAAFVSIDAILNRELAINLAVSGLAGDQEDVSLSSTSLTLSLDNPSTLFSVSVADDEDEQAANRTFNVDLSTEFTPRPELPSLTFTIPPNDLSASAAMRVEFKIEDPEQTLTINIEPPLQDSKSFIVSSEDPRLTVKTGLIAPAQSPFPVELALSEDAVLGEEELLSLNISHLDSWQQRSAQAQLSANNAHNCAIRANGTLACWGSNNSNRANPASAAGVDANTRFLSIGAGHLYSCGIKADGTMACWGSSSNDRTNPASAAGVDANTRFLAVSSGDSHNCAIKADSSVACWGFSGNDRTNPASAAGVDANTRFLAVNAGFAHNCAIKADSSVTCWGFSGSGRTNPASAAGVDASTRFLAVSAGFLHSCGIKADGRAACWGANTDNRADPTSSLQGVDADTRFLAISAGRDHNCAIKADGRVACWGDNGNNRADPTSSLQGVDANTRFLAVSAGDLHTCAIKADGRAACWGDNNFNRAIPPSDNFNRTLDVFALAERSTALTTPEGEEPVQFNEVTDVEVLHPQLMLDEGETTTLTLFGVSSGPAVPLTITLTVEESDRRFLSLSSTRLVINEAGGTATLNITAKDNDEFADIEPFDIMLSLTGDNARLTPTETVRVNIANDDIYTFGFEEVEIALEEGESATVRLSVDPEPPGTNTVAVAFSISDNEQVTVEPEEVVFSAASRTLSVVVTATDDIVAEPTKTFTVAPAPPQGTPAIISTVLSVIVLIDNDTPTVEISVERAIVPEGTAASFLIDAVLNRDLNISASVAGLTGTQSAASLSPPSLTLSLDSPSGLFSVSVADNGEPQGSSRVFSVNLDTAFAPRPDLPSLSFVIPPNDLRAHAATRVEFKIEEPEQTLTIDTTPPLLDGKSFFIFPEDPRLTVKGDVITPARSPFPVELALSEGTVLGGEERLSLDISHLDVWRQPTAQAQLSAGGSHSCGIGANGRMACWGLNDGNRANPASASGVNANTGFVSVSAGAAHTCGIKTDGALACWGFNGDGQADPMSAFGVDANARFLSLSAGLSHSCAIRADRTAVCWGDNTHSQADPASAAGVDANTRFLALSAGGSHSCGIRADSAAVCWGLDGDGQASPASAAGVDADTRFLSLSANISHTCGIKADGALSCWGDNTHSQADPTSATGVDANTRFLSISAGDSHSCGIKADRTAACWGLNLNDRADPTSAAGVDANTRFLAVSAGGSHSCGIKADGAAACWGLNGNGQASPPSGGFNQTLDVFRLAERSTALTTPDGGEPVQFNEVTEVELLHSRLMFAEGESTMLTLLRLLSGPASPVTVALAIGEGEKRFLAIPEEFVLTTDERESRTTVIAIDNDEFAHIEPIHVMLSITGDNARLTPVDTIMVTIENDEVYTIGFAEGETIALKEGESTNVRLIIDPAAVGEVAVGLAASNGEQIDVPPSAAFADGSTNTDAVVEAVDDADKEVEEEYAVRLVIPEGLPANLGVDALGVMVPMDERDSSIVVTVNPISLTLTAGRTTEITFAVPRRFVIDGRTTVSLTAEGDITVAPQVILDKANPTRSASVRAMRSRSDSADAAPRTAVISLIVSGDLEDPRLEPDDAIDIRIEESAGIRIKVRVFLEGALP